MFFFFKQKTAYEMRISDWSSDVCSSDLKGVAAPELRLRGMDEAHDREQHEETRGEAEFRASKHDRATPEAICPSRAATTMVDFRQLADQGWPHDEYRKYGTKDGPCNPYPRFRRSTRRVQWTRGTPPPQTPPP